MQDNQIRQLQAVVGKENLLTTPEECWCYAFPLAHHYRALLAWSP